MVIDLEKIIDPKSSEAWHLVKQIAQETKKSGGQALVVGGFVRDAILGQKTNDFDLEIHKLSAEKVEQIVLAAAGSIKVLEVGKIYGVLKMLLGQGVEIDISLPRRDSKIGPGHRGFDVNPDPNLGVEEATKRRDFTINSMAVDILTGELIDPLGGFTDLQNRILRVTDPKQFPDDPLRAIRAMQFVARFNLTVEPESQKVIKQTLKEVQAISKERFLDEWRKLLLKSEKPSLGLQAGLDLGILDTLYPELAILDKTPQESKWHPEGNVWQHTKIVADKAAEILRREELSESEGIILMLSALLHDIGKAVTTEIMDGRIRSFKHAQEGARISEEFLDKIGLEKVARRKVVSLVANHMRPASLWRSNKENTVSDSAIYKLADNLAQGGVNIETLCLLFEADVKGTAPGPGSQNNILEVREWLLDRAEKLKVVKQSLPPILRGQELLARGFKPGPNVGQIIDLANKLFKQKGYAKEKILILISKVHSPDDEQSVIVKLESILNKES